MGNYSYIKLDVEENRTTHIHESTNKPNNHLAQLKNAIKTKLITTKKEIIEPYLLKRLTSDLSITST